MSPERLSKSILILGGSTMQIPAITRARELGWRVVVADANPDAVGIELADAFEHVDLQDLDGMTEAARRQQLSHGLDGVFTAGTDFSSTVAWVAEKVGLPGIPYETALDASDKARMRAVFDKAGLSSPRFITITSADRSETIMDRLVPPLVIKPVDSMGARGVRRIDTRTELAGALSDALSHSRTGRAIVEQYIEGPEFSLDALVYEGSIHLCGIADRHIFFPPYFVEMGHTMPSSFDRLDQEKVIDIFFEGIRALGITCGAAKGDIKLSEEGPVIGEIAARLSGGFMSGWTYPYSSGVHLTEAAMRIAVGLPPGPLEPDRNLTAAERAFISIPGKVRSIEGIDKAKSSAEEIFFWAAEDQEVSFPTNNVQKCGSVICVEADREAAAERARGACLCVEIILEPFDRRTSAFLYGDFEDWVPDAFSVDAPENREYIGRMAWYRGPRDARLAGIVALPSVELETSTDWHGCSFKDALDLSLRGSGVCAVPETELTEDEFYLDGLFWKAFCRGGAQGARWLLDCFSASPLDSSHWEVVSSWIG